MSPKRTKAPSKAPPHASEGELTPNESAFLRRLVDLAIDQLLQERAAESAAAETTSDRAKADHAPAPDAPDDAPPDDGDDSP